MLSWNEINTFGKSGIGNESVYNSGFAFSKYIASKYSNTSLSDIMKSLSSPFNFSVRKAMKEVLGKDGREVYTDYMNLISQRYSALSPSSNLYDQNIRYIDVGINNHSIKRNKGIKSALAKYIVLLDDDCFPEKKFLEKYFKILEKYKFQNYLF